MCPCIYARAVSSLNHPADQGTPWTTGTAGKTEMPNGKENVDKESSVVATRRCELDSEQEFRDHFAARCQEEIRLGSIIGFAFACFVFAVYVCTMYPSG
jgi:hypothetical protein